LPATAFSVLVNLLVVAPIGTLRALVFRSALIGVLSAGQVWSGIETGLI